MRTSSAILAKLVLILAVLTLSLSVVLRAQVPCETPPGQGQVTTWKQNSTVNVMIDPTFTDASSPTPSKQGR